MPLNNSDRLNPSNWVIVSNDGASMTANNTVTGELFTGTPTQFAAILQAELVPPQDLVFEGDVLRAGNKILSLSESTPFVRVTTTGTVFTGACELAGFDCLTAAGKIAIYDGTSNAGRLILDETLVAGRTEFRFKRSLEVGCHVVLTGVAVVNVLVG